MKNALESIGNRADQMQERISKLEDQNTEMFQEEGETKLRLFKSK